MEYINPLGEEKVSKLLIKFSVPAIVGMMINALYNIVDRIYIGNAKDLGTNGIAGITIGFPIMIILLAIGILFGVGGATLFSMRLGQKKPEEAEKALGNSLFLLIASGVIITIFGSIFLEPLLVLFGASKEVLPYSVEYMRIILFGAVFQVVSMGINNFIRADGNPKLAMYTMFLGAGTNILLDPIFIFVFKMGMAGAALATILSQLFSAIWVVSYFLGKHSNHKLKSENMKPHMNTIVKITSLGIPGFAMQVANSLLNAILNRGLRQYGGDIAVTGMGVINSVQTILFMPVIGLNQGVQPIVSFNFGAKKFERVKTAVKQAILVATIIVVVGYVVMRIFPTQLISLFNRDEELLAFGKTALISWMLFMPVVGFQVIASNFFQAIGRSNSAMFLTLSRQVIFLIPALIIFPQIWGITGLMYSAAFADFFSTLITGIWFYFGIKNIDKYGLKEIKNAPAQ
ncbi:putative MATE family efflux protein [Mobilisporobacter senegalensis]|uniref:Multidrug export protein MepA n=1 Tax=Mobilisporobacter senegalensis TaxID=1329262 RepID=A0A3N1XRI7_9FIRM|nr:MATE family efflux transporter [Mobilisporobacter senegalensis]ROR29283.1 putative MATE family efflux protein [Mobilisporobacter senegalensis]